MATRLTYTTGTRSAELDEACAREDPSRRERIASGAHAREQSRTIVEQ